MDTAIRWSSLSTESEARCLIIDVTGQITRLCEPEINRDGTVSIKEVSRNTHLPKFRAFDWSPLHNLIAIGGNSGEITIAKIEDNPASLSIPAKLQRPVNATSFSNGSLLATGLEKVRGDHSLNVYDINQWLSNIEGDRPFSPGRFAAPLHKFATNEAVSSVRFCWEQPQCLVAGIRGTSVRLYDLRASTEGPAIQFSTHCTHAIAIDPCDENYFASAGQRGDTTVLIWDRRMIGRARIGSESGSSDDGKDGPVLELNNIIEGEGGQPPQVWRLRYLPTQRGALAALGHNGALRIFVTQKLATPSPTLDSDGQELVYPHSYEHDLLFVRRAVEAEPPRAGERTSKTSNELNQVVSFDAINGLVHGIPSLILLRGNQDVGLYKMSRPNVPFDISIRNVTAQPDLSGDLDKLRITQPGSSGGKAPKRPEEAKTFKDALALLDLPRIRCESGYGLDASKNYTLVEDPDLETLWKWIAMTQQHIEDGLTKASKLDLAYLGVYDLWSLDTNTRGLSNRYMDNDGRSSDINIEEAVNKLVEHVELPDRVRVSGQMPKAALRKLCLVSVDLALDDEVLTETVEGLRDEGKETEGAFLAILFNAQKLAYDALVKSDRKKEHMALALIINTFRHRQASEEWLKQALADLPPSDDNFVKAIIEFLRDRDWSEVLPHIELPWDYMAGILMLHVEDVNLVTTKLREYLGKIVKGGLIDGVCISGLGEKAIALFDNYLQRTNDLPTAVLAITHTVPKYAEAPIVEHWRQAYRDLMNSWKLNLHRLRFDCDAIKLNRRWDGTSAIPIAPRQITIACSNCEAGLAPINSRPVTAASSVQITKQGSILGNPDEATTCPSCGAHLPRCAICQHWVGTVPPEGAKMDPSGWLLEVCFTCKHVCHRGHAYEWFKENDVCPAAGCDCKCNKLDNISSD